MALVTPTTELEAVNECLANIGQSPVSSLSGSLGVDTQIALNYVRSVSRELQAQGWYFNTEYNFPLTPNAQGDIIPPSNTLSIDTDADDRDRDLIQRGSRIYDRENRTYTFTAPIRFRITLGLPFEELPENARRFIALRAARIFKARVEGASGNDDQTDEMMALANLKADDTRNADYNMLTDNYGVLMTLSRWAY